MISPLLLKKADYALEVDQLNSPDVHILYRRQMRHQHVANSILQSFLQILESFPIH